MIKTDPIMEQDILIGQYTLGLLTPSENEHVQDLLGADASAARRALQWEEEFLTLVDALPLATPPHPLLNQILTVLDLPLTSEPETPDTGSHQVLPPANLPKTISSHQPATATVIPQPANTAPGRDNRSGLAGQDTAKAAPAQRSLTSPERGSHKREQAASIKHKAAGTAETDIPDTVEVKRRPQRPVRSATTLAPEQAHTGTPAGSRDTLMAGKRPSKKVWMGGAAATVILVALLALAFLPRSPVEPPVVIVEVAPSKGAILQAPGQSSTPGWVVTIDLGGNVTLTPQVHTEIPADASVQLWTYNKILPQPRSLGLIDPNQPVAVPTELMGEIGDGQFFEMTLEPEGGSPASEPSGPILFIGQIVTFSQ